LNKFIAYNLRFKKGKIYVSKRLELSIAKEDYKVINNVENIELLMTQEYKDFLEKIQKVKGEVIKLLYILSREESIKENNKKIFSLNNICEKYY